MNIVECHPRGCNIAHPEPDERLHLVTHDFDLNALCGAEVARLCRFIRFTEFGRPTSEFEWCPECAEKLAYRGVGQSEYSRIRWQRVLEKRKATACHARHERNRRSQ